MKTATELLEELLKKVSLLEKEVNTNNFLLKTVLARFDQSTVALPKEAKKPPVIEASVPAMASPPAVKTSEKNDGGKKPQSLPNPSAVPPSELKEEKFAVLQIVTKDGKPVFMANIVVHNSKNEQVFAGTTNPTGQWSTVLQAGEYTISIKRNAGVSTTAIDITEMFTVSAAKVKGGKIILNAIKL